jgi:DNA-binding MarR family transcriptional regulator
MSRIPDLDPGLTHLDFMRLLWRIEHGLQSTSKRMESELGITGPQRLILKIVDSHPGITSRELSVLVRLHPSTLTGILRRLESKGLIRRTLDNEDHRWRHLHATAQARPFTRRSSGTVESAIQRALARVKRDQIAAARVVLTAVAAALEKTSSLPQLDE